MDPDWQDRYRTGETPWDTGQPSAELRRVLDEDGVSPCRALDVGCGTGTNAVFLAERGFDATGVDLCELAIDRAEARAAHAGVTCRFLTADLLEPMDLGEPFDFIFDRGCFHSVRRIDEPAAVAMLERSLAPGGSLLVLTGNTHETREDDGPPKVSEEELRHAFADKFVIRHLREFRFDMHPKLDHRPLGWSTLLAKPVPPAGRRLNR